MTATLRPLAAAAFGLALAAASPATAQNGDGERDWIVTLGAGARVMPKYPGADEYGFGPMAIFGLRREGDPLPIEAPDEGSGFGLLGDDEAFDFGPTIQFQSKRQEEDVGAAVGDVGFTVETGAFAQVFLGDNFRLRVEGRRGIGGHDGWVGDVFADFVLRGERHVFTIGPRARWGDDSYHDAYFSVTPGVAAATGLPAFDADGGFHSVGAYAGLTWLVGRNWGLYGYAGYDRLIGDAADSPIVRAFGSRDQFAAGAGLFFEFGVGTLD